MTDRAHTTADIQFYLSKFANAPLEHLRLIMLAEFVCYPALSHDLSAAIDLEIARRFWNDQTVAEAPMEAEQIALRLDRWSDEDVADGLNAVSGSSPATKATTCFSTFATWTVSVLTRP